MFVGFFAGFIPFIPYVIAIIVGGEFGESITLFLYNHIIDNENIYRYLGENKVRT